MATLEAQTKIDLRIIVAANNLIDLSNVRDDDTSEDTTITDRVVDVSVALVKGYLGDTVDGDDVLALDFAIRLSYLRLMQYTGALTEGTSTGIDSIKEEMRREARSRRQGYRGIETATGDFEDLDERYPQELWDEDAQ